MRAASGRIIVAAHRQFLLAGERAPAHGDSIWTFSSGGRGRTSSPITLSRCAAVVKLRPRRHSRSPSESSRANANHRLPGASLGRVEGGDGIVEGRDGADVRPQSSVPHPLDDLAQLGTIRNAGDRPMRPQVLKEPVSDFMTKTVVTAREADTINWLMSEMTAPIPPHARGGKRPVGWSRLHRRSGQDPHCGSRNGGNRDGGIHRLHCFLTTHPVSGF